MTQRPSSRILSIIMKTTTTKTQLADMAQFLTSLQTMLYLAAEVEVRFFGCSVEFSDKPWLHDAPLVYADDGGDWVCVRKELIDNMKFYCSEEALNFSNEEWDEISSLAKLTDQE